MATLFPVKMNIISKSQDGLEKEMMINRKLPLQTVILTNNQCQKKAHYLFFRLKTGKIYLISKTYIFYI